MKLKTSTIEVNITLENGLYVFSSESGSGKTYLGKVLKDYAEIYETPTLQVFTYDVNKQRAIDFEIKFGCKLAFFDRFDLYWSEDLVKKVISLSEEVVILLDWKGAEYFFDRSEYKKVDIYFDSDKMEVFELEDYF